MDTNTTVAAPPAAPPPAAGGGAPPAAAAPAVTPSAIVAAVEPAAAAPAKSDKPAEGEKPAEKPVELAVPKGFESHGELFKATVKELGLDGAKGQKFADAVAAIDTARGKALDESFAKQSDAWLAEAKADPDIGGAKWDGAMKDVTRALKQFGGPLEGKQPALVALLDRAGLGNNKLVLKAFAAIGRAMADDTISGTEKPAPPAGERLTDAQVFYGKPTTSSAKDD